MKGCHEKFSKKLFYGEYQIPPKLCDDMIHWFEAVPMTPMDFDEIENDVHITKGDADVTKGVIY